MLGNFSYSLLWLRLIKNTSHTHVSFIINIYIFWLERKSNTFLFRCWADCKRVPFILGYCWDVHKHVVPRMEVKMGWALDHQMGYSWREKNSRTYISFTSFWTHPGESEYTFDYINDSWNYEPLPKIWSMNQEKNPKWKIHKMRPVENLLRQ